MSRAKGTYRISWQGVSGPCHLRCGNPDTALSLLIALHKIKRPAVIIDKYGNRIGHGTFF